MGRPRKVVVEAEQVAPEGGAPEGELGEVEAVNVADSVDAPAPESQDPAELVDEVPVSRIEKFEVVRPDGVTVIVIRNIDTGEQSVTEK